MSQDVSQPGLPLPQALADAAEWQRLDPRMLLVHPVRELVRFLPVLVGVLVAGSASGGVTWELFGIAAPVALGLWRYLTTSFRIADGRVELRRGLLTRNVLSARLERVRTVDLTASPVHRLLGLTTLRIGTGSAATDDDERLDLDGLPAERAGRMRAELLRRGAPDDDPAVADGDVSDEAPTVALDLAWLRFAPLTGTGAVIFAGLLGAVAQVVQVSGEIRIERADLEGRTLGLPVWLLVAALALAALVVYVAFSVAGYLVANWRFTLTRARGSWHVRRGLFTTRETSVDQDRVAGVAVVEPWPLRLAGAARLSAIVTGLASEANSAALVPPAPRAVAERTGSAVLRAAGPLTAPLVGHGPAAWRRRLVRAVGPAVALVAVLLLAVLVLDAPGWLLVPGLLALPVGVALGVDRARALGHELCEGHLVARSGSLVRRREALGTRHVIGWNLRTTWWQRRAGVTTLAATTAGGRQAVTLIDVPEDEAVRVATQAVPGLVEQFLVP